MSTSLNDLLNSVTSIFSCNLKDLIWGVLVLLICVQILVRRYCFSHRITMEVLKPVLGCARVPDFVQNFSER